MSGQRAVLEPAASAIIAGGVLAALGGSGGVPFQASEALQASNGDVACGAGAFGATSIVAECGGMFAASAGAAAGAARADPGSTMVGTAVVERAWSGDSIVATSSLEL